MEIEGRPTPADTCELSAAAYREYAAGGAGRTAGGSGGTEASLVLTLKNCHAFPQVLAGLSVERSAALTLLTLESATMQRCLNAERVLVRQLLLVFIPECQLLVPNTHEVYGTLLQLDMSPCCI